jgi:hypothetical protein
VDDRPNSDLFEAAPTQVFDGGGERSTGGEVSTGGGNGILRWVLLALIATLIAAGSAAAMVLVRKPIPRTAAPPAPVTSRAPEVARKINVTLRATPLETRFAIDDGPPVDNPYVGTFPRDGLHHRIRATAPGTPPKEETVVFDKDVSIRFALSPMPTKK